MDKAHAPGGFYRVSDRVVDADGRDLGPEAKKQADKIDKDAVKSANEAADKAREQQAIAATGGVGPALMHLLGAISPAVRDQLKDLPATEPRAVSQEDVEHPAGGFVAAEINGDAGPTPVPSRVIGAHRVATESPADALEDEEDVLARGDEHQENLAEQEAARAAATGTAAPSTGVKKKSAAKKSASAAAE